MDRREFVRKCILGGCAAVWGGLALPRLLSRERSDGLRVGFRNDAPEELWAWAREAMWYEAKGGLVHCRLCPHACILAENDRGFCRVRVAKGGQLHTLVYGNPCSVHIDPVEKKPLSHFLPGTPIFSLAAAGCNLRCLNCQNWEISQARPHEVRHRDLPPERVVELTVGQNIPSIAYTYTEPLVSYEYTAACAEAGRERGVRNVLVSAGYINEEPLRRLCRVLDAARIDLKGFSDSLYRRLTGATLAPVLRSLRILREEGVWLEVVRLMVPTLSDSLEDIGAMSRWLVAELGPDVPLHLSRFHPAYRLQNLPPTPVSTLDAAYATAREAGLRYVYVGNVPGSDKQDTLCPGCGRIVIRRRVYTLEGLELDRQGRCPWCGLLIPGVWG